MFGVVTCGASAPVGEFRSSGPAKQRILRHSFSSSTAAQSIWAKIHIAKKCCNQSRLANPEKAPEFDYFHREGGSTALAYGVLASPPTPPTIISLKGPKGMSHLLTHGEHRHTN